MNGAAELQRGEARVRDLLQREALQLREVDQRTAAQRHRLTAHRLPRTPALKTQKRERLKHLTVNVDSSWCPVRLFVIDVHVRLDLLMLPAQQIPRTDHMIRTTLEKQVKSV